MTIQRQRRLKGVSKQGSGRERDGRYRPQALTHPKGGFLRYEIANHRGKQPATGISLTDSMFLRHPWGIVLRLRYGSRGDWDGLNAERLAEGIASGESKDSSINPCDAIVQRASEEKSATC